MTLTIFIAMSGLAATVIIPSIAFYIKLKTDNARLHERVKTLERQREKDEDNFDKLDQKIEELKNLIITKLN